MSSHHSISITQPSTPLKTQVGGVVRAARLLSAQNRTICTQKRGHCEITDHADSLMSTVGGPKTHRELSNLTYISKVKYLNHLVRKHSIILPKITSINWRNTKDRHCPVCDKTFKSKFGYTRHLYIFHHTMPPAYSDQPPDSKDADNFCGACDKAFQKKKKVYFRHIIRYHLQQTS